MVHVYNQKLPGVPKYKKWLPLGNYWQKHFKKRKTVKDNGDQALSAPQDVWLKINFTCGQTRTIGWSVQTTADYLSKLNWNKSAQMTVKNEWTMRKEIGCSDVGLGKKKKKKSVFHCSSLISKLNINWHISHLYECSAPQGSQHTRILQNLVIIFTTNLRLLFEF